MSVDVLIAAAPFLSVARPSLGASAIAAAVEDKGFRVRIEYLNLLYAERVGLDFFEHIADRCPAHFLIGEWIFADCLGLPRRRDNATSYEKKISTYLGPDLFKQVCAARTDAPLAIANMAEIMVASNARVYGFTTTFQQNCASLALAKAIKTAQPDAIVVLGGANCDGPMGQGLADAFPYIDFVFSGEADITFPKFLEEMAAGEFNHGHRVRTGMPIVQMDALPMPQYGDYFDQLTTTSYRSRVVEGVLFESARGCWWGAKNHCKFCGLNGQGMTFRSKSADRVLSEIRTIAQTHGVRRFAAADNIMDMRHISTVFDVLAKEHHNLAFFYEVKSNLKTDQLSRISAGGVTWIQPGIESLDDEILIQMGKGVTGLQNIRLLRSCVELGLHPVWNMLCGFPSETAAAYDDMASMMPALAHLPPPSGHSHIRLDRFSPYYERANALGFNHVRPAAAYPAIYGLSDDQLAQIAYFFEGDAEGLPSHGYLDSFIDAIAHWRAAHVSGQMLPDLLLIDVGGVKLIKDTRGCATQNIKVVSEDEHTILTEFREPARVEVVLSSDRCPVGSIDIYADLIARKFIYEDRRGHAVTLVCESKLTRPDLSQVGFPGGYVRPAAVVTPDPEAIRYDGPVNSLI